MKTVKLAVFGAGLIGRRHAQLVADHAHLAAVVDPDPKAQGFAKDMGADWFASPDAALAQGGFDGVIIATPNQLHEAHALACIEKGLPVLVEKPITDTTESAARLVAASDRAGVPVLVGHHRRHNPRIAAAKAAIDGGRLGALTVVNAQFWLYKPPEYFDQAWRREKGAGPVFINLIHDIDLLRHLCGEVIQVTARQSCATRGFAVEDSAVILLEFANGALGTVSVSDTTVAPWSWEFAAGENPAYPRTQGPAYMIGGTHGSLSVPDLTLWSQPEGRSWWHPMASETLPFQEADPLVRQLTHFCDVITRGTPPLVSGREGLNTLKVVEAIKQAAEQTENTP